MNPFPIGRGRGNGLIDLDHLKVSARTITQRKSLPVTLTLTMVRLSYSCLHNDNLRPKSNATATKKKRIVGLRFSSFFDDVTKTS